MNLNYLLGASVLNTYSLSEIPFQSHTGAWLYPHSTWGAQGVLGGGRAGLAGLADASALEGRFNNEAEESCM